jgi:alkylation response protein AidB-like acyl-CoA dehydrogenase
MLVGLAGAEEGEETLTTLDTGITTPRDVLDAARRLTPTIAARADEIEAGRRVPRDLLDELIAARVFRVLRPATHGGLGADLPDAMLVYEALARADASVGWTAMIGSASWCDLAGLPRAAFDELFSGAPDAITAGAFNPTGSIAPADGGYRASGRWGFASGCEHADWIYGNHVEAVVDGVPRLRIAVFSPDQVVIEDTWTVSGLCGTGSHHFHVDSVVVPAERTLVPLSEAPCLDAPIARVHVPALIALVVASVALGAAQGALDDIVALAADKVPLLDHLPLAANPTFQLELATADTELNAARALIYENADAAWEAGVDATELTLRDRARIRAAAAWATERAADVVRAAYRAGGGGSVYAASPLQRRLRDIDALTQHFIVRRDTLTTAGAILAGQDVDVMVF